jgi:hypothetical protein
MAKNINVAAKNGNVNAAAKKVSAKKPVARSMKDIKVVIPTFNTDASKFSLTKLEESLKVYQATFKDSFFALEEQLDLNGHQAQILHVSLDAKIDGQEVAAPSNGDEVEVRLQHIAHECGADAEIVSVTSDEKHHNVLFMLILPKDIEVVDIKAQVQAVKESADLGPIASKVANAAEAMVNIVNAAEHAHLPAKEIVQEAVSASMPKPESVQEAVDNEILKGAIEEQLHAAGVDVEEEIANAAVNAKVEQVTILDKIGDFCGDVVEGAGKAINWTIEGVQSVCVYAWNGTKKVTVYVIDKTKKVCGFIVDKTLYVLRDAGECLKTLGEGFKDILFNWKYTEAEKLRNMQTSYRLNHGRWYEFFNPFA